MAPHASGQGIAVAPSDRMLVIGGDDRRVVFPVSAVHGIHRYHVCDLSPAPATVAKSTLPFTFAMLQWRERSVACLDADKLLSTLDRAVA
jgi:chemotaxis-related protein WspD